MRPRIRHTRRVVLMILMFASAILAGKGLSLVILSRDIDSKAMAVADVYERNIHGSGALLAVAGVSQREDAALKALNAVRIGDRFKGLETIESIIAAQRAFMHLLETVRPAGPLIRNTAFKRLKSGLEKNGDVQALLDSYNARAQKWNNQADDLLGRLFVRAFSLKPRLLLQADGKEEYETILRL